MLFLTHVHRQRVSEWILMSRQLHRVASGQENDVCVGGRGGHSLLHHKFIAIKLNFFSFLFCSHLFISTYSIYPAFSLGEHAHTHTYAHQLLSSSFLQPFIHFKVLCLSVLHSLWECTHTHACTHTHTQWQCQQFVLKCLYPRPVL